MKSETVATMIAGVVAVAFSLLVVGAFSYGFAVQRYKIFPYFVMQALMSPDRPSLANIPALMSLEEFYDQTTATESIGTYDAAAAFNALNLVTAIGTDGHLVATIVDMNDNEVHAWSVDWFDIWPDAEHIPEAELPTQLPGTLIDGARILGDGDLVFSYNELGLVRIDLCGKVKWRLPYRTHHSLEIDEQGNIWERYT